MSVSFLKPAGGRTSLSAIAALDCVRKAPVFQLETGICLSRGGLRKFCFARYRRITAAQTDLGAPLGYGVRAFYFLSRQDGRDAVVNFRRARPLREPDLAPTLVASVILKRDVR